MSRPSIGRSGSGAPASARDRREEVDRHGRLAHHRAGGDRPGQRATNGTRTPPSKAVPLPSRSGPAEPAWSPYESHGPLSEVKTTSVSRSRREAPERREDSADRPVDLLDHVAVEARFDRPRKRVGREERHVRHVWAR